MKNFIIESYSRWLHRFAESQDNKKLKLSAEKLSEEILDAHSINQAQNIIQKYTAVSEYDVMNTAVFHNKILEWNKNLTLLESRITSAKLNLASVDSKLIAITPLIALVTDILEDPQNLLHCSMLSFVTLLSSPRLQDTLQYVASLDKAPAPIDPPPGTFAALKPLNSDHADCIQLILNNSAAIDSKNVHWEQANSLLQNLLLMHKDVNEVDPKPLEEQSIFSSCVIS
jgi:hypothetical protein